MKTRSPGRRRLARRVGRVWLLASLAACGGAGDAEVLYEPWIDPPGPRQPAFLAFESRYDGSVSAPLGATDFPKLLSDTGAFADLARLVPVSGIVPYDIQVPLWSDGAYKRRWVSLPEGTTFGYSETEHFNVPAGTVFIKHFEMAFDERFPDERRRLETRFWIAASERAQYGVSYRWNEEQTDAELVFVSETETLTITGPDGETREQPYFFPGPGDCHSCHNEQARFVLGARAAQLNRKVSYRLDRPATDQLAAWSAWGLLDARLDAAATRALPRLATLGDQTRSVEERIRSYWDGNCSMCHAGDEGRVPGWDARFGTPFEERHIERPPQDGAAPASHLITPGAPEDSYIYLRGDTTQIGVRMPPLGRNRIDQAYVDLLGEWIGSLPASP